MTLICGLLFIVGVNCHFDPMMSLDALKLMKNGLEEAGLLDSVHLMCQPLAFKTPDAGKFLFMSTKFDKNFSK